LSEKEKDQSVNPSPRKEPLAFAYKSNKYQPTDHEQHIENLQKEIVKLYNQMESISYKDIVTMNLRSWGFFEAIKHWLKVKK
jgi:TolA-binding protein